MKINNQSKKNCIIVSVIFIIIIAAFFISGIISDDREFSENENRKLSEKPELSFSAVVSGKYSDAFESYVQDQFPLRDTLMAVKTKTEITEGKKDNGMVYFGKDGFLFSIEKIDTDRLKKNIDYVNNFCETLPAGIESDLIVVPTASTVLKEKLPGYAVTADETGAISEIVKNSKCNVTDLTEELCEHSDEYIYYRTDHHWTSLGAYYGYRFYNKTDNRKVNEPGSYRITAVSDDFYGTNYSKALLPSIRPDRIDRFDLKNNTADFSMKIFESDGTLKSESDSLYDKSFLSVKDKYSYFIGGNNPLTIIKGGEKNGCNLLIIKDSFAHCFIPFIAGDYETIVAVDMRYYRKKPDSLINEYGINKVLFIFNILNFANDENLVFLLN